MSIWDALQALDTNTQSDRRFRITYLLIGAFFLIRAAVAVSQGNVAESLGWLMVAVPLGGIGVIGMNAVRKFLGRVEAPSAPLALHERWITHPQSVVRCGFAMIGTAIGLAACFVSLRAHPFNPSIALVLMMSVLFAGLGLFHWLIADASVRSMLVMKSRMDPF